MPPPRLASGLDLLWLGNVLASTSFAAIPLGTSRTASSSVSAFTRTVSSRPCR